MISEDLRRALTADVVSESAINEAAGLIALKLGRMAEGSYTDPATWHAIAECQGIRCRVFHQPYPNAIRGVSGQIAPPHGFIYIMVNGVHPPEEQAITWVHELAHVEVMTWMGPQLQDGADMRCYYDDDRGDVSHCIARVVERLVFELPP